MEKKHFSPSDSSRGEYEAALLKGKSKKEKDADNDAQNALIDRRTAIVKELDELMKTYSSLNIGDITEYGNHEGNYEGIRTLRELNTNLFSKGDYERIQKLSAEKADVESKILKLAS